MSTELDLDDVAAQSPLAQRELDALRAERDALRATLAAIETCAERAIGCTASEMDGYMVQIGHAARTGGKG